MKNDAQERSIRTLVLWVYKSTMAGLKKTSFELLTNTIPVPNWLKPDRFVCFVKVSTNMVLLLFANLIEKRRRLSRVNFRKDFWDCIILGTGKKN